MALKTLAMRTLVPVAVASFALLPSAASAVEVDQVPVGEDVFIDHVQTGEHLTPNGFATTPTSLVDLWEDHNGVEVDAEKWQYNPVRGSSRIFQIENAGGNVCLEPDRVEYRKVVSTKNCSSSNRQQWWHLWATDTGVEDGFTIRPYNDTELAITPSSVPTGNDHYTVLSPVGDYDNQVFRNRLA